MLNLVEIIENKLDEKCSINKIFSKKLFLLFFAVDRSKRVPEEPEPPDHETGAY